MNGVQILAELGVAIAAAVALLRFWRQVVAFLVGTVVALTVIGLMTVLRWIDALPR
ncbi:MAG: hypothetical protein QG608_719 [Actinomycetota bacterium]|nr:hypothetical protein [Actinomycetota bacterium]